MATVFEIFISHKDRLYAQQAAREAFEELERIEKELSRFVENSDISRINNLALNHFTRIGLDTFECLKTCQSMYRDTGGAFDISLGTKQSETQVQTTCLDLELDETHHTVRVLSAEVDLDLGGVGKGYALDKMGELMREWSVENALIHGGTSSILAMGSPPEKDGWTVTLSHPVHRDRTLATLELKDRALSGSGIQKGEHIVDPRTGKSPTGRSAAWALANSAAISDALSTTFMVMSHDEVRSYCSDHEDVLAMVVEKENQGEMGGKILPFGPWKGSDLTFMEGRRQMG